MEWFLGNVCTPDWNLEQDRGRDWDEAVALLVEGSSRRTSRRSAPSTSAGTRPSQACSRTMWPCCSACARRACRTTASRISPAPNSSCRRSDIPFLSGFDGIIVSGDERLLKPDPAIYHCCSTAMASKRRIASSSTIRRPMWKGPARWACTRSTASSRSISRRRLRAGTAFSASDGNRTCPRALGLSHHAACALSTPPSHRCGPRRPDGEPARAAERGARGAARRRQDHPRAAGAARRALGERGARSSCWSLAGSPPALRPRAWRRRSARPSARRWACAFASAPRSAARPASRW